MEKKIAPQPTESEAIVASERAVKAPGTRLLAPVPLPVDVAGDLPVKGKPSSMPDGFLKYLIIPMTALFQMALAHGASADQAPPHPTKVPTMLVAQADVPVTKADGGLSVPENSKKMAQEKTKLRARKRAVTPTKEIKTKQPLNK